MAHRTIVWTATDHKVLILRPGYGLVTFSGSLSEFLRGRKLLPEGRRVDVVLADGLQLFFFHKCVSCFIMNGRFDNNTAINNQTLLDFLLIFN